MTPYAGLSGGYNVLLAFMNILILLLTAYMGLRFIRRTTILTAAVFMFQLCILTAEYWPLLTRPSSCPFLRWLIFWALFFHRSLCMTISA